MMMIRTSLMTTQSKIHQRIHPKRAALRAVIRKMMGKEMAKVDVVLSNSKEEEGSML